MKTKYFHDGIYKTNEHQYEVFIANLKEMGITDNNFEMVTVNCPRNLTSEAEQLEYLEEFENKIFFAHVGCREWSDKRSKGNHFHIIIMTEHKDDPNFKSKNCFISKFKTNHCLTRCLRYICKEKRDYKWSEKSYFSSDIGQKRKLIPISKFRNNSRRVREKNPITEKNNNKVLLKPRLNNIKKEIKKFFVFITNIKNTSFFNLFIIGKRIVLYGNRSKNICQNTRDGPSTRW